jgi:hypothetical protein
LLALKKNIAYGVYWGKTTLKKDGLTIMPVKDFCRALWAGKLL